ncbi:MAG: hypothetical protein A3G87_06390 [Omnitrophica bacterium RIFCSPLOWO2_12_FULL_50_11]|nr:MAG: hypothetical protein A3G87_06390 [Omnitrophica bacterium RIFCSPLOWO2_12_FULL_50_11]
MLRVLGQVKPVGTGRNRALREEGMVSLEDLETTSKDCRPVPYIKEHRTGGVIAGRTHPQ